MKKNRKNEIDIASMTKLSVGTVKSYLDEKPVHRSTEAALERLIETSESESPTDRTA